jgi:lambda family phage portal protein
MLTAVLPRFEQLDDYIEAIVIGAEVAACFTMFVKSQSPQSPFVTEAETSGTGDPVRIAEMEPGGIMQLRPGDEVDGIGAKMPNDQFDAFVTKMLRLIGIDLGLPLEIMSLDFSKTNYSSARASLQQAYLTFKDYQETIIEDWIRPLWRWKVDQWIADGILKPDPKQYDVKVFAPGWAWIDPEREINAQIKAMQAGVMTQADAAKLNGDDWLSQAEQRAIEIKKFIEIAKGLGPNVDWRDLTPNDPSAIAPSLARINKTTGGNTNAGN